MNKHEWNPDDIDIKRIAFSSGLGAEFDARQQRDLVAQRFGHGQNSDDFQRGYRAFFEGKPQSGNPSYSAWARGWQYAQLEDDDD
jgi:hypothetical protein